MLSEADVLFPTPTVRNGQGNQRNGRGELLLPGAAESVSDGRWGQFGAAVRRWEALTRPAPAATEPSPGYRRMLVRRLAGRDPRPVGRRGSLRPRRRLAAVFPEWMMGLPAGHVTDPAIGISRNAQLKLVGNGVCPQQGEAALRELAARLGAVTR